MNEGLFLAALIAAAPAGPARVPPAGSQTLTLRAAVERALERSPEVALARAATEEAEAGVSVLGSDRKPQFLVNTTPGWSTGAPLSVAGEVPAAAGARLRMTLYDPLERSDEFQGQARVAAAKGTLAETRVDVARRTAAVCAKLSADEARVGSARRRVSAREAILLRERALAREGRRTELDVERAALEEARAREKLYAAESDRDLDRHELASLAGLPAEAPFVLAGDPEESIPEPESGDVVALALARDRQLQSLSEQADVLERSSKLLSQAFKPAINAEARYAFVPNAFGYDKYYLNFQENVASVGVSIVLPVLTGGRETARAAQSRAQLEQLRAQRHVREQDLSTEVRRAEALLARAGLEAGVARRAVAVAEGGVAQQQALAREGRGEADGVDSAQIALAEAEEELAGARRDQLDGRLRLLALQGELLSALGVGPAPAPGP
ncbi:MAG TPA: TolC family protein [Thermoanaerobaculia bacterium]|nr:TolC family protein [Thermoanaerobaculia bacterium]